MVQSPLDFEITRVYCSLTVFVYLDPVKKKKFSQISLHIQIISSVYKITLFTISIETDRTGQTV